MDTRTKIGLLLIVYTIQAAVSAPRSAWTKAIDPTNRVRRSDGTETGRIFWSPLGDILGALPFLPLTINVPDLISGAWSFFTAPFTGSTSTSSSSSSSGNKKPKRNSTSDTPITRDDLIDYFLY